ncbi:MAG: FG-GAP repeat protein [Deltaproteobacteria bacterium]|nr:FG-GAP repeat protein [Deltaproteobacteria bacterium]
MRMRFLVGLALAAVACGGGSPPGTTADTGAELQSKEAGAEPTTEAGADASLDSARDTAVGDRPDAASDLGSEATTQDRPDAMVPADAVDGGATLDAPTDSGGMDSAPTEASLDVGADRADSAAADSASREVAADVCAGAVCSGLCVDTQTDRRHCGRCGRDCAALPGVGPGVRCVAGRCALASACSAGRGDCDGDEANGCEAELTTAAACGACGAACAEPTPRCAPFGSDAGTPVCVSGCADATPLRCGGRCVDGMTSAEHCGGCGRPCVAAANATAACRAGACERACNRGFGDCDRMAGNGCEADLSRTTAHCGACGNACAAPRDGSATCEMSACVVRCDAGFVLRGGSCVGAPLRLRGPMSGAWVTTHTPRLSWVLPIGADGARVELCAQRACTTVLQTFDAEGSEARVPDALSFGVVFWRATALRGTRIDGDPSAVWELVVPRRNTPVVSAWGATPDVNGDGLADVIVGAQSQQVWIYHGRSGALATTPTVVLRGPSGSMNYGYAVSCAGDLNGDGFSDVVVGARGSSQAFVYQGSPTGVTDTVWTTLTGPTGFNLGAAVASPGDTDGDGYGDLLVSAPGGSVAPTGGFVNLYRGGPLGVTPTPVVLRPDEPTTLFGFHVASAGDVDGDGWEDVMLGAPGFVDPSIGYAYLYANASGTIPTRPTTVYSGLTTIATYFGFPVGHVGDLNGDGYSDVAVGLSRVGTFVLYHGSASGLPPTTSRIYRDPSGATAASRYFGSAGDVNGDGYGDMVVGTNYHDRAYIYHGGPSGIPTTPARTLLGTTGSAFGLITVSPGDIDGDRYSDLIIAAPAANRVYIHRGGASGVATTGTELVGPTAPPGDFGVSLGGW